MQLACKMSTTDFSVSTLSPEDMYHSADVEPTAYLTSALEALLAVTIVSGNFIVFLAFGRSGRASKGQNFYILQLAIADFTLGLLLPFHIVTFVYPVILRNIYVCVLRFSSALFFMSASILSLLALTVDRYQAIHQPLTYKQDLSFARRAAASSGIWIFSLLIGCIPSFIWNQGWSNTKIGDCDTVQILSDWYVKYVMTTAFFCASSLILAMYVRITRTALHHVRAIDMQIQGGGDVKSQLKAAKTVAVILGLFYICWLPFVLTTYIQVSLRQHDNQFIEVVRTLFTVLAILNSAMNPIIYAFRMQVFKTQLKKIFKCHTQ